jgi:hypothetical protein
MQPGKFDASCGCEGIVLLRGAKRLRTGAALEAQAVEGQLSFDAEYEIYEGDFDSDGDADPYVREKSKLIFVSIDDLMVPIARPPAVSQFSLLRQPDGSPQRIKHFFSNVVGAHR